MNHATVYIGNEPIDIAVGEPDDRIKSVGLSKNGDIVLEMYPKPDPKVKYLAQQIKKKYNNLPESDQERLRQKGILEFKDLMY